MKTYRHLNFLIDGNTYDALRRQSRKLDMSISRIAREAIASFLENGRCSKSSKGLALGGENSKE
ncbi:hypothetical protein FBQ80_17990 [Candidatus Brocadia sp. AMX2]|uniref:hypothetical protein n=1 Tax=Candidatus Brocadia TaxID=380240 RepID=UPI0006961304|nr:MULTISPECIES: hypothetical protein [Brocadia]MDL1937418.1 hypothetical protein [Candidatus Brocadia sp. AMX2]NOG42785.1 hypothetical protein [Planctomycetota bacterium]GIK12021.1 MAG: hypothetical protein BroJett002_07280 [Candidatus Brocadia sinica]